MGGPGGVRGGQGGSGGSRGASDTRAGATYTGTCLECVDKDVKAMKRRVGPDNYRNDSDILENKTEKSSLAKHTGLFHKDKVGDQELPPPPGQRRTEHQ